MVGEGVGATLEVECLTCLVESEISKWMGAKEIEPKKSHFFFFFFKYIVSLAWYSYNFNFKFSRRNLESTKDFLYKCLAAPTLSCEELEQKKNKWEELEFDFQIELKFKGLKFEIIYQQITHIASVLFFQKINWTMGRKKWSETEQTIWRITFTFN